MPPAPPDVPQVDAAGFTLPAGDVRPRVHLPALHDPGGPPLRCASVLKPLYFWAAAPEQPAGHPAWAALAEPAVVSSANDPTVHIWQTRGPAALLDGIARLTGVHWQSDPSAEPTFGRVLVRAGEVARAYAGMADAARAGDVAAALLLGWMRQVALRQTFGARTAAAERLGRPESEVSVKTGWFIDPDETALRTHAVTVTQLPDGSVRGTAVLTALPVDASFRTRYATTYVLGDEVLPLHWDVAAETIRRTTAAAL